MKTTLLAFSLLTSLLAEEINPGPVTHGPVTNIGTVFQSPTVEALQSEIAQLRADLKAAQITRNADIAACWSTDLNAVQARFQAALAQKEAADLRNAPKPEALAWTGGPQEWTARRGKQIIAMVVQSADGYSLYRQDCETPERPCRLEALVKSLDEAKARAKGW